jgi:hypothetical protein
MAGSVARTSRMVPMKLSPFSLACVKWSMQVSTSCSAGFIFFPYSEHHKSTSTTGTSSSRQYSLHTVQERTPSATPRHFTEDTQPRRCTKGTTALQQSRHKVSCATPQPHPPARPHAASKGTPNATPCCFTKGTHDDITNPSSKTTSPNDARPSTWDTRLQKPLLGCKEKKHQQANS